MVADVPGLSPGQRLIDNFLSCHHSGYSHKLRPRPQVLSMPLSEVLAKTKLCPTRRSIKFISLEISFL